MPTIPYKNRAGKRLAGVTTVLNNLGWSTGALMYWSWTEGMDGRNFRDSAGAEAQAGTLAHFMIECHLTGEEPDLSPFPLPKDKKVREQTIKKAETGFGEFLEWQKRYGLKALELPVMVIAKIKNYLYPDVASRVDSNFAIEMNLVSEKYQYGFTIDIVGHLAKILSIVDIKTANGTYPDHLVQGAAYQKGWNEVMAAIGHPEYQVSDFHLLRLGKNDASFHHHRWADLEDEWGAFLEARSLHERHKRIKKRV